jgi:DNA-binding response OmpR family regulator
LEILLNEPETVFSKTQIAERVWGSAYYVSDNTIEATISTLRQKLAESFDECEKIYLEDHSQIIETIRGAGYRLNRSLIKEGE